MGSTALNVPSGQDLINQIRKYGPRLKVYNGGREWLSFEYDGQPYHIPPDLDGEMVAHPVNVERHPNGEPILDENGDFIPVMVMANGEYEVMDHWGNHFNRYGKLEKVDAIKGCEAINIVIWMQREYGKRGLVWLRGAQEIPSKDAERKVQAQKLYWQGKRVWAADEVAKRQGFVDRWRKLPQNKDKTPPLPTELQSLAQEIMDSADESKMMDGFACNVCFGFSSQKWEAFSRHMQKAHNLNPEQAEFGAEPIVKRGPGRPRKNP